MGRGLETPLWKRHCVIAYAFDLAMPQTEISQRLNLTRPTVNTLIQAARARSPTSDLAELQAAVSVQPRSAAADQEELHTVMRYPLPSEEVSGNTHFMR